MDPTAIEGVLPRLRDVHRDLQAPPGLSFVEHRTARVVADWLREHGLTVTEGVGDTGVTSVLRRGDGPVVLLRADRSERSSVPPGPGSAVPEGAAGVPTGAGAL